MEHLTRIKLDRDYVKSIIPQTKTFGEMVKLCGCSENKLRDYIRENGLYKYYCEQHHIPYDPTIEEKCCTVCGSKTGLHSYQKITYCKRHFLQMYRHGKILESTIYDRNEIKIIDNVAHIIIKNVKQEITNETIIDVEDVDKIKNYKWYVSGGYCITKAFNQYMGTDIANVIFNDFENRYDHINHNRLDNRKVNLRPVTSQQNAMNMGKKCTNTSGVTGVAQENPKLDKWMARLVYQYKTKWLGSYDTFDEAVHARLKGEIQYFGEYSPNYNPDTKTIQLNYHSKTDDKDHFIEYSLEGELLQCS